MEDMEVATGTPLPNDQEFDHNIEESETPFQEVKRKRYRDPEGGPKPVKTKWENVQQATLTTQNRYDILKNYTPSADEPKLR